jgi:NAD(P)-dependent dehydrogenase (short-subunit alcohol dehydrogenase family)
VSTPGTNALEGRVAVVTGANSGIGKETAVELAGMGAHVIIAARNPGKAAAALEEVLARKPGSIVETLPLDLASFASVHAFADAFKARFDRLDILVNNAGGSLAKRTVTEDGHETQFQVNHLSHFLLTALLHEQLLAAPAARVVNVSSTGHTFARDGLDFDDLDWERRRYRGFLVYCATKLANVLFTRELARRVENTKITSNAVHPGFVGSNFGREGDMGFLIGLGMLISRPLAISSAKGARTSVYLASSPDVSGITGQYFYRCKVVKPSNAALDDAAAAKLWDVSAQMTGLS